MLNVRCSSLFLLSAILLLCSCSQEQIDQAVTQVQGQVQEQVHAVEKQVEQIVPNGSVELLLNKEVKIDACNVALLVLGDGRPNIVQLKTYTSLTQERFPSLLFQATTSATSLQQLVGTSVNGELFIALDNASNIWHSETNSSATVVIRTIDNSEMIGQLSPTVVQSPEGRTSNASGLFHAVIEGL